MPKMPLAKYHDMVKAFPSDRPNQPLTIAILPWRPRRDRPIPNTDRAKAPDKDLAINAVPIADEIAWPLFPAISVHQLATYPFRAGMRGRRKTQDFAAPMLQNQQPIQELKPAIDPGRDESCRGVLRCAGSSLSLKRLGCLCSKAAVWLFSRDYRKLFTACDIWLRSRSAA